MNTGRLNCKAGAHKRCFDTRWVYLPGHRRIWTPHPERLAPVTSRSGAS
jgi:hypothetical protein